MANDRIQADNWEYAIIDAAPAAGGYFTNPVSLRKDRMDKVKIFFSVRETDPDASAASVMTVTLQFKCSADAGWQDYNTADAYVAGDRKVIDDGGAGVYWRAGVKEGGYTSGSLTVGFDW